MEERLRVRLENFSIGASVALFIILVVMVPLFVLDYDVCTAPDEFAELRMLTFVVTLGVAAIAAFGLALAWRFLDSRKLKYAFLVVLLGLGLLFAWFVLYFSRVCTMP